MVPHRAILQAIALVSALETQPEKIRVKLCNELFIKEPLDFTAFWDTEIRGRLPVGLYTQLMVCQPFLDGYDIVLDVATHLGVGNIVTIQTTKPELKLPAAIRKWRQHESQRKAIEIMLFCDVSPTQICNDLRTMYGTTFDESDVVLFRQLFADPEYSTGIYWEHYAECIPIPEFAMKSRMRMENKDFVRWKLGVPVALNTETVLNRLMSDAYFTERLIKHGKRDPLDPSALPALDKDELTHIKMERETIFKCVDRMTKLKESSSSTSEEDLEAKRILDKLKIRTESQSFDTPDMLTDG